MPIVDFVIPSGKHLLINARRESTSIMVDQSLTYNYDREGRLISAWLDGRNYRRSLDNRVLEKQQGTQAGLAHRTRTRLIIAPR
jgi:hypothetical protein